MKNPTYETTLPLEYKNRMGILIIAGLLIVIPFLPWIAFTTGEGYVSAIDPNERVQSITMPVNGFISQWLVSEGDFVKRGQTIANLQDNDPELVQRYKRELEAGKSATISAKLMLDTSKMNLDRQRKLFEQGLTARKEYEKAKIETSKMEMEYSKSLATLTKAETQVSRQLQVVMAPRDGVISRILPGEKGQIIKAGAAIAVLTPEITTHAVELWIDGNDAALISAGKDAVIQFEGWPSIQIPGWPSVAIGTFKAKVHLVDPASSFKGKFRVLLKPVGEWPSKNFLRPGAHAKGNIIMTNSFIIKEVWRQLTGFPPVLEPIQDELNILLKEKPKNDTESEDVK
jgi:multidrug resistance efflux pump